MCFLGNFRLLWLFSLLLSLFSSVSLHPLGNGPRPPEHRKPHPSTKQAPPGNAHFQLGTRGDVDAVIGVCCRAHLQGLVSGECGVAAGTCARPCFGDKLGSGGNIRGSMLLEFVVVFRLQHA